MNKLFIAVTAGCFFLYGSFAYSAGSTIDSARAATIAAGKAVFSDVERRVIEEYMARRGIDREYERGDREQGRHDYKKGKHKDKGNGKHRKHAKGNPKGLPPGIQMKLARGGTLPPGIAKKHLPHEFESRLPPVKKGYDRYVADGKVVLVETATGIITDVIDEVMNAGKKDRHYDHERRDSDRRDADHAREFSNTGSDSDDKYESPGSASVADHDSTNSGSSKWWQFWK